MVVAPTPAPLRAIYGGTFTYSHGTTFPTTWDPHPSGLLEDVVGNGLAYNQLVEFSPTDPEKVVGDLAESWSISNGGQTYTFNLRSAVKWMDGEDFTADDVVFSIDRIMIPGAPRPRQKIINYVDRTEKVDELTVDIHLNFPSLAFLPFLALDFAKIVPKHLVEAGVDIALFENGIGTGPYKRVSMDPGASYEIEKNPSYFKDGLPYLDGFKAIMIKDKGTEIAAYRTERILMSGSGVTNLDIEDYHRLEDDIGFMSRFGVYWIPGAASQHVMINTDKAPFDNPNVRRAMFLAMDRQEITDAFGPRGAYARGAPMSPQSAYSLPLDEILSLPGYRRLDGNKHPDDIAEAIRLLEEAGFPNGFSATFSVGQIQDWPDVAQVFKEQMKVIGIDLDIQLQPLGDIIGLFFTSPRSYDLAILGVGLTIPDPDDAFTSIYQGTSGRNWTGWGDARVDELLALQKVESDFGKRKEMAFEMQRIVLNGAPGALEYTWRPFAFVVSDRLRTGPFDTFIVPAGVLASVKKEQLWLEPE